MVIPKITESMIRAGAAPESFRRGEEYYREGSISNAAIQGSLLSGECAGTYAPYYRVQVELDQAGIAEASCTCLYEGVGRCKHIVALLLAYAHHPKAFVTRKAPAELLADLGQDDLIAILTRLMQQQPELYDRIEALISVPSKKSRKKRKKVDIEVYRRHILDIVHSLDGMRRKHGRGRPRGLLLRRDLDRGASRRGGSPDINRRRGGGDPDRRAA